MKYIITKQVEDYAIKEEFEVVSADDLKLMIKATRQSGCYCDLKKQNELLETELKEKFL